MKRTILIVAVVGALAGAIPARATLLVRSDGAGLLVQDKNGLNDHVLISKPESSSEFEVNNLNTADFFKFDRQVGCRDADFFFKVICVRNRPLVSAVLAGGDDSFSMLSPNDLDRPAPPADSSVNAGSGDDSVRGNLVGKDHVVGISGADTIRGFGGDDHLEGSTGNDTIRGDGGADLLEGGDGNDSLRARESSDESQAVKDTVRCGSGNDFIEGDLKDTFTSCEQRDIAPVGETPNVKITAKTLRVTRNGRVRVRLACPRGVGSLGCKGRLRLDSSPRVRYSIRAGRRKTVTLTLSARAVRRLRGKRRRGVLTSLEKGRKGPKTTVRNPRLRVR